MKLPTPTGWVLWCSCIAPAAFSLALDSLLRFLELKGRFIGDPDLGASMNAGYFTLLVCTGGSLFPAIWLNKKEKKSVTLVYWFSLAVLNIVLTVPGCSMLWG